MLIQSGQKLLFIGDSITDAGRARPVGEGLGDAVGTGYVGMVDGLLNAAYPERSIRVVNMGVGGNTIRDLDARWPTDVFDQHPDWVAVMIGANDVWRQFDCQRQRDWHIPLEEYAATYERLITATLPRVKGLLLVTPYYIEANRGDAMRARMDQFGDIVRRLAGHYGLPLADAQAAVDAQLRVHYPSVFGWDRVHPNHLMKMVLARTVVDALGFEWHGDRR